MKPVFQHPLIASLLIAATFLSGCSMSRMVVDGSKSIMDGGEAAMNRETDLELARAAIPANFKILEGLIQEAPDDRVLRVNAAKALYGYTFGFVESEDTGRASQLYQRCLAHGAHALAVSGVTIDPPRSSPNELREAVAGLGRSDVPAMFWTASCWAKSIDLNRSDPASIAQIGTVAAMMERVLELEPGYYHGAPHIFFGVYYGARPPMFGGDPERSLQHFEKARGYSADRLLLIDVLQAQYLARQQLDRDSFNALLTRVTDAPDNLFPEMALSNAIARRQAGELLKLEDQWF